MKTKFSLAVLAVTGLGLAAAQAQGVIVLSGGTDPAPAPAVVYQAPVVYQVPVIYQAPVVYQAPVTFEAPVIWQAPPVCAVSSVVYIGGSGGCEQDYCGTPASTGCSSPVIYFGRGESIQRGYQFTHPR